MTTNLSIPAVLACLLLTTGGFSAPAEEAAAETAAAEESINWMKWDEVDKQHKHFVSLSEEESVHNVLVALVRLRKLTPSDETDSVMVYDFNSAYCGSGGCQLSIFSDSSDGSREAIFSVSTGSGRDEQGNVYVGVSLGNDYTNGMRNLRFEESVTWVWDGTTYQLK